MYCVGRERVCIVWGERERVYCVGRERESVLCGEREGERERVYCVCVYVKEGNIQCYIVCIGDKHVLTTTNLSNKDPLLHAFQPLK